MKAQKGVKTYSSTLSLNSVLVRGVHTLAALPLERDPAPIVQEAGWAKRPVWMGAGNLIPTRIYPQTIQHIASRYTDHTTPAHPPVSGEQEDGGGHQN